jgi:hypothetical protein
MGCKLVEKVIENLLVNLVLEFFLKNLKYKMTPFHASFLVNGLNRFWARIW